MWGWVSLGWGLGVTWGRAGRGLVTVDRVDGGLVDLIVCFG